MSKKLRRNYSSYGNAVAKASSGSVGYQSHIDTNPFGPGMAESVFNVYDDDDMGECEADEYYEAKDDIDEADLFDGVHQSYHFRHQEAFDLETNEQRENRLKSSIRRFESAYRRMSLYALKWHYLMEEVEDDDQVKKMFKDMQMIRKLRGSDCV